ncbi:MAG: hypothetical protein U0231_01065 [Nitrospiraceae bacterium]
MVAALVLVTVHVWGAAELFSPASGQSITVAAIQPNIHIGERATEAGRTAGAWRLERLTRGGIVTSEPHRLAGKRNPGDLSDPTLLDRLRQLSHETGVPLVPGAAEVEKIRHRRQPAQHRTARSTAPICCSRTAPPRRPIASACWCRLPNMCRMPTSSLGPVAPCAMTELTAGDSGRLFTIAPRSVMTIVGENLLTPRPGINQRRGTASGATDERRLVRPGCPSSDVAHQQAVECADVDRWRRPRALPAPSNGYGRGGRARIEAIFQE